ncbi:MAG: hypothetical protein U0931_30175 [Vulcanimicrobiota bacterium]
MGTLEEILAQLKAQDSRLQELELENGRLRDQVADLKSQLEKVEKEGKQQAALSVGSGCFPVIPVGRDLAFTFGEL